MVPTISLINPDNVGNIILHQIVGAPYSIQEVKPTINDPSANSLLTLNNDKTIVWSRLEGVNGVNVTNNNGVICIDVSVDLFKDTNIHYQDGRIGFGRSPMYSYRMDIAVSENSLVTAIHIGDGKFGFSLGNGTQNGFIPEMIGMGSDENDAGLYLIGRAGNSVGSIIPLIVLDGRSQTNGRILNRPILGVTNSNYTDYLFVIDHNGDVAVNGVLFANNIVVGDVSLKEELEYCKREIDILNSTVNQLKILCGLK